MDEPRRPSVMRLAPLLLTLTALASPPEHVRQPRAKSKPRVADPIKAKARRAQRAARRKTRQS